MTTTTTERMLPLYEAKMLGQFDHRDADVVKSETAAKRQNQPRYLTSADHRDPDRGSLPAVWVDESELPQLDTTWLSGFSDVTSSTNERTILASALPAYPVGHTYPLVFGRRRELLLAAFNSFALDYIARQKVAGLHLTYTYVKQFPLPLPATFDIVADWDSAVSLGDWVRSRVLELVYTSWDMRDFARELGSDAPPFTWDERRRQVIRAEVDAAFFFIYAMGREDTEYVLDSFTTAKKYDQSKFGEFLTKRLILETYDEMQRCIDTGSTFVSTLDPAPGFGPRHPERSDDE